MSLNSQDYNWPRVLLLISSPFPLSIFNSAVRISATATPPMEVEDSRGHREDIHLCLLVGEGITRVSSQVCTI